MGAGLCWDILVPIWTPCSTNPAHLSGSFQPRMHLLRWIFPCCHTPKSCFSIYFPHLITVLNNYLAQIISSLSGTFFKSICVLNLPIDYVLWSRLTPSILHSFQRKYYWAPNRNPGFCEAWLPAPGKLQARLRCAETVAEKLFSLSSAVFSRHQLPREVQLNLTPLELHREGLVDLGSI